MLLLPAPILNPLLHSLTFEDLESFRNALSQALVTFSTNPQHISQPHRLTLESNNVETLIMPTSLSFPDSSTTSCPSTTSIKIISLSPNSPPTGLLTIFAPTGLPLALLSANPITGLRTALTSLLLPLHANRKLTNIIVFGTGTQAEWILRLHKLFYPDAKRWVVGRNWSKTLVWVEKLNREVNGLVSPLETTKVGESLRKADGVFCCTPSMEPLFDYRLLGKGVYLSLIGSWKPEMREVAPDFLVEEGVRVVVDSREACGKEAGEVIAAGLRGRELWELGEVLVGGETTERWGEGTVVFKCVGLGIMDAAVGREVVRVAEERGVGTAVEGF